ncbi:MAG: hypothetical protein PF450_01875, partial [Bacteroidales bacterium]|nr:hypothetical protein [Bacteroidales bacterium]
MRKFLYILLLVPFLLNAQHYTSCPLDHHFENVYENPLYQQWLSKYYVIFYHLSLVVSYVNTYIEGFTTILLETTEELDTLVFQLIDQMSVTAIEINSVSISIYTHHDDAIFIPINVDVGQMISATIYYKGDAGQDRGFFAGISSTWDATNNQQVTYTLSEPLNARDWFPVKQVLTDKADSVWVDLTCSNELMAGSNGLLKEIEDPGNGKHTFKWRSKYPIAY